MQSLLNSNSWVRPETERQPVTIAESTRRVYDSLAGIYPLSTMLFHSRAHRGLLHASGIEEGMRVLEIATGSGEMFRRLVRANRTGSTIGLDISPNMAARTLRRIRTEFPTAKASCQAVDARYLPFRDESFDAVVACYLLELLSTADVMRALKEMRRVLRPQARLSLVLIGDNTALFNRLYRVLGGLVPAFWGRQISHQVPQMLARTGMRLEHDWTVKQTFYPSRVLISRK